jgi:hypothetical protein
MYIQIQPPQGEPKAPYMHWNPTDKTAVENLLVLRYENDLAHEIRWAGSIKRLAETFRKHVRYQFNRDARCLA